MARNLEALRQRYESHVKYDDLLDALNFIEDELGGDKAAAVRWIQAQSGGGDGTGADDLGEVGGDVWGAATYCESLSGWAEIVAAVASILSSE